MGGAFPPCLFGARAPVAMSERNPGWVLDLGWVEASRVNLPATERRASTHKTRRSIKKEWQAAWLLRVVTCIDLTTLDGDDTPSKVSYCLMHMVTNMVLTSVVCTLSYSKQVEVTY